MVKEMISERKPMEIAYRRLEFDHKSGDGCYSFDADESGNVQFDPAYEKSQRKSYNFVINSNDYEGPFFRIITHHGIEDAKAICECGKEIILCDQYLGASKCPYCGKWHNMFGETLVTPDHWGDDH